MTDRQQDLFGFVGAAFAVMIGLFLLQELVRTAGDRAYHAEIAAGARHPDAVVAEARDAKALASGRLSIDAAMQAVATKPRGALPSIAPKPSEDLSCMGGWVHRPGFTPYVSLFQPPPEPAPIEAAPAEGEAAPTDGEAAAPSAAAPAPTEGAEE